MVFDGEDSGGVVERAVSDSLFATHTTVCSETLLYHIPTWGRPEFPGLKNPSAKVSPFETRMSPSLAGLFGEMVSREMQNRKTSKERSNDVFNNSLAGFMVVFPVKILGWLMRMLCVGGVGLRMKNQPALELLSENACIFSCGTRVRQ
jgi:hypothetical protein